MLIPLVNIHYFEEKKICLLKADIFTANLKRDAQLWDKDVEVTESDIVVKLNAHEEKLSSYVGNNDI